MKTFPIEIHELILDYLRIADIFKCRVLSKEWNDRILSYWMSSSSGKHICPLIQLYTDDEFKTFVELMEQSPLDIPFYKFYLNVFNCTLAVIRRFANVCGRAVSECTFQIHPPGVYEKHYISGFYPHPSTPKITTSKMEYAAYVKMAVILRLCVYINKLYLFDASPFFYEYCELFLQLPESLPQLKTMVVKYYRVDPHSWTSRYTLPIPTRFQNPEGRSQGNDFASWVVTRARNLKVLRLGICNKYGDRYSWEQSKKCNRIIELCTPMTEIEIEKYGTWTRLGSLRLLQNFEKSRNIKVLTMVFYDRECNGSCLVQHFMKILPTLTDTLRTLSLDFSNFCLICKSEGVQLPGLKKLTELSLTLNLQVEIPRKPVFHQHFPNLLRLSLDIPGGSNLFRRGYTCESLHTLVLGRCINIKEQRFDILFPNLKVLIFSSAPPTPFIFQHLPNIEHLQLRIRIPQWETLTGELEELSDESVLNFLESAKTLDKSSPKGKELKTDNRGKTKSPCLADVKLLKSLKVTIGSTDTSTLKAFVYLAAKQQLHVPSISINCLCSPYADYVHSTVLKYLELLRNIHPGFTYTLKLYDKEYACRPLQLQPTWTGTESYLDEGRVVEWQYFVTFTKDKCDELAARFELEGIL